MGMYLKLITDNSVIGIIIAKEQQRSIFSKKNVGSERHLVSFTLRDSPSFFVNVTCWGNSDFIADVASNFEVGSVVKLKNVQVQPKAADETDEKFKPWTPVSFQLNVSENHSSVESYTGWDSATYRDTLCIPTRPNNDYYTLEDISISGMALQGEHVNILAAIKKVGQIRYLTTKTGKQTKKCDVVLFDDTTASFCLDLWQSHADLSLLWTPFETVLFMADVKITYNTFKSAMVGSADSKTIFTMDPDTPEAHCLRQFLRTQDSSAVDMDYGSTGSSNDVDPDLNSITEVLTVQQLKEKRNSMQQDMSSVPYYGILYAMVTSFNVDTNTADAVRKICNWCRKRVSLTEVGGTCTNPECSNTMGYSSSSGNNTMGYSSSSGNNATMSEGNFTTEYNIPVALSDHTGTVSFCHLQAAAADAVFTCLPQAFLGMTEEQRTNIKWQYLMEHCKVIFKLKMFRPGSGQLPAVQILSLEKQSYQQTMPSHHKAGQAWHAQF
ncbi:hypothetical protein ACOMHN_000437 [Nucella lapillus]